MFSSADISLSITIITIIIIIIIIIIITIIITALVILTFLCLFFGILMFRPSRLQKHIYSELDGSSFVKHNLHSPTLYSKITGEYASLGSKIFPHILLLCSISYSCDNGLTINQHFIKPLQGEKCTSYLSVVDLSIVLSRVFFFAALCGRTNLRLRSRARTPTKLLRSTF